METVRESSRHFIAPGQLLLSENALGNPDLIQVSVGPLCSVTIVDEKNFPLTELEQWPVFRLTASDIKLNAGPGLYYIYIVVPVPGQSQSSFALLGYSTVQVDVKGLSPDGSQVGMSGYRYYPAGTVSAQGSNPDVAGGKGRTIQIDLGRTPPEVSLPGDLNDYDKIFQIDKVDPSNSGSWLLTILSEVKSMVARSITVTRELVFGTGDSARPVTGVASGEDTGKPDKVSNTVLATTAWVKSEFLELDDRFLRKDSPDTTHFLLSLFGGATFAENVSSRGAVDSMVAGKGSILTEDGRIQTDRLEVRQSMKVMELIINRLQGTEHDYVFSPTRKVVKAEQIAEATYRLVLEPLVNDAELIPFHEGNILYSIVNDLLTGGSNYYTSYSRVLSVNQNEYSITVVLYPDAEVPGGKNHPPVEGYNISRRGDVHLPSDGQSNPDSQSWYLSSSEGRLMFLQNVIKPVLDDYNYALSVGKFPNIKALDKLPISKDEVGIMAQTIVVENLYQYDYNGDVMARKVNRGAWAREVAVSDKPYRNVQHETKRPTGTEYTLLEQHTVYHLGCLWGCLTDKTQEEPKWNAQGWQLLEGNSELAVSIASDNGDDFYCGEVDTNLDVRVYYGHNDITEDVLVHPGAGMEWFRDTGDAPADNLWKPNYVDGSKLKVHIDNSNQHGVGSKFGFETKRVVFTCNVFVPVDGGTEKLTATYGWAM